MKIEKERKQTLFWVGTPAAQISLLLVSSFSSLSIPSTHKNIKHTRTNWLTHIFIEVKIWELQIEKHKDKEDNWKEKKHKNHKKKRKTQNINTSTPTKQQF